MNRKREKWEYLRKNIRGLFPLEFPEVPPNSFPTVSSTFQMIYLTGKHSFFNRRFGLFFGAIAY